MLRSQISKEFVKEINESKFDKDSDGNFLTGAKPRRPMTPEEIVEYIHTENTPYSQMSFEDQEKELVKLIKLYADWYAVNRPIELLVSTDKLI